MKPYLQTLPRCAPTSTGWAGLFCLMVAGVSLHAQELPARTAFLNELLTESQVLTEQYERALSKLETELAQAADYEEAQLVQRRRDELKAIYAQTGKGNITAIPLPADKARVTGTTEARGDMLTGWRTTGSIAEWSNLRITPGTYFLELTANIAELPGMPGTSMPGRAQPHESVSFTFYEISLLPGAQENRRTFDIMMSKDDTSFTPLRIGPVTFARSPVTVRLTPAAGYPGNLVRLRQIRLVQVHDEVITAAPMPDNGDALKQAKNHLLDDLASVQKPVLSGYEEKLKALANSSPKLRDEITAETSRLEMLKKTDSSTQGDKPILRALAKMSGVTGFQDIDGAKLVAADTTRGDRLMIEHDGRKIAVRLLWLECASLTDADDSRKSFAKHFSIDVNSTTALANAAKEFTIGYLEGKSLRLLIRPGKEKDGSQAALVFLPEVGLYQNILVDQGLAAVRPPVKESPRGIMEKSLLGTLLEREASARRQKNGAWALASEDKP
jgi:hypothetical protein